jgi:hypothetical protein
VLQLSDLLRGTEMTSPQVIPNPHVAQHQLQQ